LKIIVELLNLSLCCLLLEAALVQREKAKEKRQKRINGFARTFAGPVFLRGFSIDSAMSRLNIFSIMQLTNKFIIILIFRLSAATIKTELNSSGGKRIYEKAIRFLYACRFIF